MSYLLKGRSYSSWTEQILTALTSRETESTIFWRISQYFHPTHRENAEIIRFNELTLAFEVGIEFKHHNELTKHTHWDSFEHSFIHSCHRGPDVIFKHIVLDFSSAYPTENMVTSFH